MRFSCDIRGCISGTVIHGGLLSTEQINEFMQLAAEDNVLLGQIDFSFQQNNHELDSNFEGDIDIPSTVFGDNVEQDDIMKGLKPSVIHFLAQVMSRHLEDTIINGDINSVFPTWSQLGGILKQAKSNVVDAAGAPFSVDVFKDMVKAMPSWRSRKKKDFRFYTAPEGESSYRGALAQRQTCMGDCYLDHKAPLMPFGATLVGVPFFPTVEGQTSIILTHPKNILFGIKRIQWSRIINQQPCLLTLALDVGLRYKEEEAVVKAINVRL